MTVKQTLISTGCALSLGMGVSAAAQLSTSDFTLSGVSITSGKFDGREGFKIAMPSSQWQDPSKETLTDRDFMAWLPLNFHNGTIEVDIASTLAAGAPDYARGFAGVSFRIQPERSFENIYLRPTNSQAEDQVRRNHSVQYFAWPDYRFDRLRKESPEKYETYADFRLNHWVHMKIVVDGQRATLYLDNKATPALIVNDLKLGSQAQGGVGIWIESGSEAWFSNLKVTPSQK
jgi:hypothetical protein